MDFVNGMDNKNFDDAHPTVAMDPFHVRDKNRLRKELQYFVGNAMAVEAVLVALNHMQIDYCYLRRTGFEREDLVEILYLSKPRR